VSLEEVSASAVSRILGNCSDMCQTMGREPYFYLTRGDPPLHRQLWDILSLLKSRRRIRSAGRQRDEARMRTMKAVVLERACSARELRLSTVLIVCS
jgi:hypothetical protein